MYRNIMDKSRLEYTCTWKQKNIEKIAKKTNHYGNFLKKSITTFVKEEKRKKNKIRKKMGEKANKEERKEIKKKMGENK